MRNHGTYQVYMIVKLGSQAAFDHLERRFAMRARGRTLEILKFECDRLGPNDYVAYIRYTHTCRNKGNAQSDAKRFVHNAMRRTGNGELYRYEIEHLRTNPWKAAKS